MNYEELKKIIDEEDIQEGDPIILEIENMRALSFGPMNFKSLNSIHLIFKGIQEGSNPFSIMGLVLADWIINDLSKITKFGKAE